MASASRCATCAPATSALALFEGAERAASCVEACASCASSALRALTAVTSTTRSAAARAARLGFVPPAGCAALPAAQPPLSGRSSTAARRVPPSSNRCCSVRRRAVLCCSPSAVPDKPSRTALLTVSSARVGASVTARATPASGPRSAPAARSFLYCCAISDRTSRTKPAAFTAEPTVSAARASPPSVRRSDATREDTEDAIACASARPASLPATLAGGSAP
mmetsp:Transcript_4070/g.12628  ORF Transcript_4070/g.12628 Transcript_4070/m.12628 type:complete len:222 (-) Transcript_4070:52-717(-)